MKQERGKTEKSLTNSKKVRANFLFRVGIKGIPHSILYHDRSDKSMDFMVNSDRSYGVGNKREVSKIDNRQLRKAFTSSGKSVRSLKNAPLSRFPQNIGRILIKFFCPENGIVYDPFAGHNSRMQLTYECNRNYIGVDVSHEFMEANHEIKKILEKRKIGILDSQTNFIQLIESSSDNVDLKSGVADFSITSPPYWDLEYYGDEPEQLGNAKTYNKFIDLLFNHIKENYRILKPGSYCAWFINDFTKNKIFYPYHIDVVDLFKKAGFSIHSIYIIDLGPPISDAFVQSLILTKQFPKRHEYCVIGKKEGVNDLAEQHIQNLIKVKSNENQQNQLTKSTRSSPTRTRFKGID